MYRVLAVSLSGRLSRLKGFPSVDAPSATPDAGVRPPAAEGDVPTPTREATLAELRERIQRTLERSVRASPRPELPRVDVDDLPFAKEDGEFGTLHVRTLRFGPSHRTGRAPVATAKGVSSEVLALLALDPAIAACDMTRALYLDTETTGLSSGAGTVAFLVGLAFFDAEGWLVVEQLLVRNLGEEGPVLRRVDQRIREASCLVTFNGKSFDLPVLRTRFVLAGMPWPEEPAHLDLVHVARRLHKPRGLECTLTGIERNVLGFERVDDVPSGQVSACYLHFLRSGDASALMGVVEHNAWDVVSMASLVGLYGQPMDATELVAEDLVGVARTFRKAGRKEEAMVVAESAVERGGGNESLRARAEIAKALGDRTKALADFESLAAAVDSGSVRLELAKLYEHFVKAPERAMAVTELGTGESDDRLAKRRRRLEGKIAKATDDPAQPTLPGVVAKKR
ncbi:MAG: ribonuclease H-like domain-containing protein [Polyangiaceae bacterium]